MPMDDGLLPAVAKYPFMSQRKDELSFEAGAKVLVRRGDIGKKWWKLTSEQGRVGFGPANYIELMEDPEASRRSRSGHSRSASASPMGILANLIVGGGSKKKTKKSTGTAAVSVSVSVSGDAASAAASSHTERSVFGFAKGYTGFGHHTGGSGSDGSGEGANTAEHSNTSIDEQGSEQSFFVSRPSAASRSPDIIAVFHEDAAARTGEATEKSGGSGDGGSRQNCSNSDAEDACESTPHNSARTVVVPEAAVAVLRAEIMAECRQELQGVALAQIAEARQQQEQVAAEIIGQERAQRAALQSELDKAQLDKAMLQASNERLLAKVGELEQILLEVSKPVQASPCTSPLRPPPPSRKLPARPPTRPNFSAGAVASRTTMQMQQQQQQQMQQPPPSLPQRQQRDQQPKIPTSMPMPTPAAVPVPIPVRAAGQAHDTLDPGWENLELNYNSMNL